MYLGKVSLLTFLGVIIIITNFHVLVVNTYFLAFVCKAEDAVVLPPKDCGPVCFIFCEYGYVLDANGCRTCVCINPCALILCPPPLVCKVVVLFCSGRPCGYIGLCVCPHIVCNVYCRYGYQVDINGCKICSCLEIIEPVQ